MEFTNCCDYINQMLLTNEINGIDQQQSVLVHSAIYPMVQKYLIRSGVNDLQHLGSYELTVGAYKFDMEILVLGPQSVLWAVSLFKNIIKISQFTYFWDNRITLFREVDRYYELEEFIAINKLKKYVIGVEKISGVNSLGQPIKLVTFDSTINEIQRNGVLVNYEKFLRTKSLSEPVCAQTCHYYLTRTFPWQMSDMARIYSSPFLNQRIFLGFQTFLTCMRELTYAREPYLDLISFCSMKLAFCDELHLTEASSDLEFEIDALIERFLRRMVQKQTYIQNGEFDLRRYIADTNCPVNSYYPAVHNLIYTFQHIFHRTNIFGKSMLDYDKFIGFTETLKLIDESQDLKILRTRSNMTYIVDGQNYNKMNTKLFCELLKCRNVEEIVLDTNHQWTNKPYLTDSVGHESNWVTIRLVGTNKFNFIEDFIQFLNTVPTNTILILQISEVTLKSYNIFKNLENKILEFHNSKITFAMLTGLLECDLKNLTIGFFRCTIEDNACTWSLLINGFNRKHVKIEILEEEKTWQYLFESIANHLPKSKLNEFNFKCGLGLICKSFNEVVWVNRLQFKFDEFNTRLELQNGSGEAIELYHWKNIVVKSEDDYENFEFYQ